MGKIWGSTLTRNTPLRSTKPWDRKAPIRKTPPKPRRPMNRVGKKTKEWDDCRAKMKPLFQRAGITVCEAQFPGCWRDNALSFAHSKKRRNIAAGELDECALLCVPCHEVIEAWPEERMTRYVRGVIAGRKIAV